MCWIPLCCCHINEEDFLNYLEKYEFFKNVMQHNWFVVKFCINNILCSFYAGCPINEKIAKKCGRHILFQNFCTFSVIFTFFSIIVTLYVKIKWNIFHGEFYYKQIRFYNILNKNSYFYYLSIRSLSLGAPFGMFF